MTLNAKGLALLSAVIVTGCSHLPLDGPAYRDIDGGAAATLPIDRHAIAYDYALVDVNAHVLDSLDRIGNPSLHTHFGMRGSSSPGNRMGVGDVLQVSIFESATGGLFLPAESGPRPANFVTIPSQVVSRSGTISVPYAGAIRVAGRTTSEAERDIERKLASRAIEPQVVLSVIEQNGSSVSVLGDTVNGANKFKIAAAGDRMLDIISRAWGVKYAGYDLYVTLQRNGQRATIHFPRLVNDPKENIFVAPGDTLYIYRDQQKYVAIGALGSVTQTSGVTGQFAFDQERLSLNEALAKAGGLQDTRANPAQVFLYRIEHRETLEKIGVDLARFAPEQKHIPTIYRSNFRDPSSFFMAQKFSMRNKDVIYAANSDSTEFIKFLSYLRAVTSTVSGVAVDTQTTRDIISGRHILTGN